MKLTGRIISATLMLLLAVCALAASALAQNRAAVLATTSFTPPVPMQVAPGDIITVYAAGLSPTAVPANADHLPLPTVLAGISGYIEQFARKGPAVPLLSVFAVPTCPDVSDTSPFCVTLTGIRLQVPFEAVAYNPASQALVTLVRLFVTDQAGNSAAVDLFPVLDRIHILTFEETHPGLSIPNNRLAQPLVTHADGSLVTAAKPAKPGEQLVAYAVGLGYADPFPVTGAPSPSPAPRARTQFLINYAFSPNAAPSRGLIPSRDVVAPTFAGLSPGSVGLYQFNFVVPAVPTGTLPCGDGVSSNLTVSFVGYSSLDGAPICVAVP